MDVAILSRLQFAAATMFHFLFVPLTLGLSILIAIMETKYARTGDEQYLRMTRFWGKLFLIFHAGGRHAGLPAGDPHAVLRPQAGGVHAQRPDAVSGEAVRRRLVRASGLRVAAWRSRCPR